MRDETAGDPVSGLKWTRKTTKKISTELLLLEIRVSPKTVGRLLTKMGFSLKTNRKTLLSGGKKAQGYRQKRNQQFININAIKAKFRESGSPVISVDTKKKELVGNFKHAGKVWAKTAKVVHDHDFKSDSIGVAVPYGIYDVNRNQGYVVVGSSKDTPSFATDSVAQWWKSDGQKQYPTAKQILICADGGGSNSSRSRVWKKELQEKLCNKFNLSVTVCHYPPGASKWNPIEHRLFSEISKNWAGVPLKDYQTIIHYISSTTTETGLKIKASLNKKTYATGKKVANADFQKIQCRYANLLPQWNYTLSPNFTKEP